VKTLACASREAEVCEKSEHRKVSTAMKSKQPVERGQRYRDVHPGVFGASGTEWIVEALFRGTDGVRYAQLVCAADLTQQKTLSVDVLSDRRRFQRL
jgi:hypothetical protein